MGRPVGDPLVRLVARGPAAIASSRGAPLRAARRRGDARSPRARADRRRLHARRGRRRLAGTLQRRHRQSFAHDAAVRLRFDADGTSGRCRRDDGAGSTSRARGASSAPARVALSAPAGILADDGCWSSGLDRDPRAACLTRRSVDRAFGFGLALDADPALAIVDRVRRRQPPSQRTSRRRRPRHRRRASRIPRRRQRPAAAAAPRLRRVARHVATRRARARHQPGDRRHAHWHRRSAAGRPRTRPRRRPSSR